MGAMDGVYVLEDAETKEIVATYLKSLSRLYYFFLLAYFFVL